MVLDAERDRCLAQAAQQCAVAVFTFLSASHAVHDSFQRASAMTPQDFALQLAPTTVASGEQQQLGTPVKEAHKSLSFPAMAADSNLWSPVALFQQPVGSTRSTGRGGGGGGPHSPPKASAPPPPLFDAVPLGAQLHAVPSGGGWLAKTGSNVHSEYQRHAAGLVHWTSEVSANMAAMGGGIGAHTGNAAVPAAPAAGSPISSPRAAALMAVCRDGTGAATLARLTSNLSSHHSACPPLTSGPTPAVTGAAAAAAAPGAAAPRLAHQRSDLAELAQLAEDEECKAAAGATVSDAAPADSAAWAAVEAGGGGVRQAMAAQRVSASGSREHQQEGGSDPQAQHSGAGSRAKRESEGEESNEDQQRQAASKRRRVASNSLLGERVVDVVAAAAPTAAEGMLH
ncbi:hypothetical protein ACK3TF_000674 [Chlorella vulgaris]